jgi:hypothetical protein
MDLSTSTFFKTPTREHFFCYEPGTATSGVVTPGVVTLVTLYPDAPAIERMPYTAGLFSVWGCVTATRDEFERAYRQADDALRPVLAEPRHRSLTPARQAS